MREKNEFVRPENVDAETARKILDFFNRVKTPEEIAGIEPQDGPIKDTAGVGYDTDGTGYDIGLKVAGYVLDARKSLGGAFTCLYQIYDVKYLGPDKFTDIVNSFRAPSQILGDSKEYFVKLTADRKASFLQDTPFDPEEGQFNLPLIDTSMFKGSATETIWDIGFMYDEDEKMFKAWAAVWNPGRNRPWSIYYTESMDIKTWSEPQEVLSGRTEPNWGCNAPHGVKVLKDTEGTYHMWYSIYHCPQWQTWVHHRASADGVNWGEEKIPLQPGGLSDDGRATAVWLENGRPRLYYYHQVQDSQQRTTRMTDFEKDGVAHGPEKDISGAVRFIQAATALKDRSGNIIHRVWHTTGDWTGNLFLLESMDEGGTWEETRMGFYTPTNYKICDTFFGKLKNAPTLDDLIELKESMGLHHGIEQALDAKLDEAKATLDTDDVGGAEEKVGDFLNQVRAQTGKKITEEQAKQLREYAEQILDSWK